jgi:hypothetical protein
MTPRLLSFAPGLSQDGRAGDAGDRTLRSIHVIASAAKQSILPLCGEMDCVAALAMTASNNGAILRSRDGLRPRFASSFALEIRGRREDRVHAAPAVSCAIAHKERAHEHTGPAETLRPSLRNGFTAYFELSPVNGSFATVAARKNPRNLMPAPRHQDHTTSPYVSGAYVSHLPRPSHLTARS